MCGLTYKKIFFQILCFIIVKYFDIDIVIFCLMCDIVSDWDWQVMRGVQKINSKTVTSSMLGHFRFFSCLHWLKTRLWQVSHMISGISQMFRMVVKMMPGIKILQVCDDFDEFVFLMIRCFTTDSFQSFFQGWPKDSARVPDSGEGALTQICLY